LALYRKNEDIINVGAYTAGSNHRIDRAIACREKILDLLRQSATEASPREDSFARLQAALA
ncbi:MAG: EscN/YscN/HrcN family type III secretion system ATPase, partial [Verrucomicrobiota bacterium]